MYKIAIGIDLDWSFEHHYDVIRGINNYAKEHEMECSTEPWLELSDNLDKYPNNFDGIIARVTPVVTKYCKKHKLPLVNVWENSPAKGIPTLKRDFKTISQMMVDYFINRGFNNITFFKRYQEASADEMAKHFIDALRNKNLEINENTILEATFPLNVKDWESFNKTISKWLKKQEFPIALCTSDYFYARYVIEWCKKNDVLIPDDISILSASSNELICDTLEPTISRIKNRYIDFGYEAARTLHSLLKGEKVPKINKIPPGVLIERRSTDVEPVNDRIIARALRYIRDNTSSQIQVVDVSDSVNIARRSLERRFRKHLNRSINEEILRSKLESAKKLLLNSDKTISEIAKLTGISSGQRLSQLFRKHLDQSITEFRRRN